MASLAHRTVNYFRESYSEMKKVVWPTRRELVWHTIIVLIFSLVIAIFLASLDFIFAAALKQFLLLGR